jgi:hypothetical protein
MRGKIRFSRWLLAATVLAVAECTGTASLETALPAARAQSSGNLFRSSWARPQSDKFSQNLYASQNWRRQHRNPHRPTDSARTSPQHKTKLKPDQNEPTKSRKLKAGTAIVTVQNVPLPRPRPPPWPEPHSFAEAAGPDFNAADVTSAPSDCNQRLATIADIELLPRLIGPGDCGGRDMVRLDAVVLPDHRRVEVNPTAVLRCAMAESFAAWVRDETSAHIATLGAQRGIETYGSYECRGRNGVSDAKLSEHGKGNAIDVRALVLAGDRRIELTDETVAKPLREALRDSACHRFTTVLGPGADSYHNNHIHLDILERTHGSRICQWDVREPPPATKIASAHVKLAPTSALAQPQSRDNQTITVGPWAIATTYKANKFESCAMSRSEGELGITFVRTQDGLLVILDSPKWKLDRGKAYSVRLLAGSRSVDAKALAETQSVTIALADARLNSKLRSASILEVHGEGATLRVPLDGSSPAFERLETCFNRREASGANPFVGRNASDTNPFVAPSRKR